MSTATQNLQNKAAKMVKAQSTASLLESLSLLELGAPEPIDPAMPVWSRTVGWIEDELIVRLDCETAHTDWVLSDAFGNYAGRTSWAFFAEVAA